jgi:hypothetical protein
MIHHITKRRKREMSSEYEVAELQQALGSEEERIKKCQREINRLRAIIRENNEAEKPMVGINILDVELDSRQYEVPPG